MIEVTVLSLNSIDTVGQKEQVEAARKKLKNFAKAFDIDYEDGVFYPADVDKNIVLTSINYILKHTCLAVVGVIKMKGCVTIVHNRKVTVYPSTADASSRVNQILTGLYEVQERLREASLTKALTTANKLVHKPLKITK